MNKFLIGCICILVMFVSAKAAINCRKFREQIEPTIQKMIQIEKQQEQTNKLLKSLIDGEKKSSVDEVSSEEDANYNLIQKMKANRY